MTNDNKIITLAAMVLAIFFMQLVFIQDLNNKVSNLSKKSSPIDKVQTNKSSFKKHFRNKTDEEDNFFKDNDWYPYAEIQRMQKEMDKVFGESFSRFHKKMPLGSFNKTPDLNLQEKNDRYIVTLNTPGANESSLNVSLKDRQLNISIKTDHREETKDVEDDQYRYRERFMGEYNRTLTLPGPVNSTRMKTDYRKGVLTITIPKK